MAIVFLLAITCAVMSKANAKFVDARYKEIRNGVEQGNCLFPTALPSTCIIVSTPQMCTVVVTATVSQKLYQDSNCVLPYYRQQ